MTRRITGFRPITSRNLKRYIYHENRKIRQHKRKMSDTPPSKIPDSLIPEIKETKCYLCGVTIKEGMNVTVYNSISQIKIYHEDCAFAKNIEPKPSDVRYPLDKVKHALSIADQKEGGIEIC